MGSRTTHACYILDEDDDPPARNSDRQQYRLHKLRRSCRNISRGCATQHAAAVQLHTAFADETTCCERPHCRRQRLSVYLPEIDHEIAPGNIFGEIAFFAPDQGRTVTAVCKSPTRLHCLSEDSLKQLYFQNPSFGFYMMNLVASRLSENIVRLEVRQGEV
jgi:CRP-like cAMP-binding protein